MKNELLLNETEHNNVALRTLSLIEQRLEREKSTNQEVIQWQQKELKRLHDELTEKDKIIATVNKQLAECGSQSEGNRQLINKLITDIDKLQQNIDWYKRTYETRSLFGVIKDKLKYFFK